MSDRSRIPSPDEVDGWRAGPTKKRGLFRKLRPHRTIEVDEQVGEHATRAAPPVIGDTVAPAPSAPDETRPRVITFAPGVLDGPGESLEVAHEPSMAPVSEPPARPDARGSTPMPIAAAGGLTLFPSLETRPVAGPTPADEDASGVATLYRIVDGDGRSALLGDVRWGNDERSIAILETAIERLDGLVGRLRMTVQPSGSLNVVELSSARWARAEWPSLGQADIEDLGRRLGIDVVAVLTSAGAVQVGLKETMLGVTNQRRSYWCAVFGDESAWVPPIAFFLTRVVPVYAGFTH